jgi:hypothetical protein
MRLGRTAFSKSDTVPAVAGDVVRLDFADGELFRVKVDLG